MRRRLSFFIHIAAFALFGLLACRRTPTLRQIPQIPRARHDAASSASSPEVVDRHGNFCSPVSRRDGFWRMKTRGSDVNPRLSGDAASPRTAVRRALCVSMGAGDRARPRGAVPSSRGACPCRRLDRHHCGGWRASVAAPLYSAHICRSVPDDARGAAGGALFQGQQISRGPST